MRITSSITLALALAAGTVLGQAQPPKILFDFEADTDLAAWALGGTKAELTVEHATHGTKAAKITYSPGEDLRTFMHETGRQKLDLSGYTHLVLDVFAPAPMRVTLKLKSGDSAVKWDREYKLDAGPATISVAFETTGLDLAQVSYLNLFTGGLAADTVLFVDDIRAEKMAGGAPAAAPAAASAPADKLVFDFETPEELAQWQLSGTTAELSGDHATHGAKAATVLYTPGDGLKTFIYTGKKRINLAGCTHLLVDFYAPVNMSVTIKLKSGDSPAKWEREYALEPEAATISIPFEGTGLNPADLSYFNFYTGELGAETVLYLDNIRGTVITAGGGPGGPAKPEQPDGELF